MPDCTPGAELMLIAEYRIVFEALVAGLVASLADRAGVFLVVVDLIPDALETRSPDQIAWSFVVGFGLMALVQVVL